MKLPTSRVLKSLPQLYRRKVSSETRRKILAWVEARLPRSRLLRNRAMLRGLAEAAQAAREQGEPGEAIMTWRLVLANWPD